MANPLAQLGVGIPEVKAPNWVNKTLGIMGDVVTSIPSLSREILYSQYPDNYELYKMLVQVVDINPTSGKPYLVEEFEFNILPEDVPVVRQFRTAVLPTMNGNFILDSLYEAPSTFNFRGTFGVNHKATINIQKNISAEQRAKDNTPLNTKYGPVVLTGYGLVKRLEKIIKLSKGASADGTPYKTYLINMAFNSKIQIEFNKVTFRQSVNRNMQWTYDFTATKVSDDYSPVAALQTDIVGLIKQKVTSSIMSSYGAPILNQASALIGKYV